MTILIKTGIKNNCWWIYSIIIELDRLKSNLKRSTKISKNAVCRFLLIQWLAHGRWFSQCTPVSSTTKTGRHDIAEILLKVAFNTKNQIKKIKSLYTLTYILKLALYGKNEDKDTISLYHLLFWWLMYEVMTILIKTGIKNNCWWIYSIIIELDRLKSNLKRSTKISKNAVCRFLLILLSLNREFTQERHLESKEVFFFSVPIFHILMHVYNSNILLNKVHNLIIQYPMGLHIRHSHAKV
jgi:predicted DNA-binding transcriptional regulator